MCGPETSVNADVEHTLSYTRVLIRCEQVTQNIPKLIGMGKL